MQTFGRLVSGPRCVERSHNRWVATRAGEIHRQGVTSIYPRPSTHWLQGVGWRGVPTFTKAMVSLETRPPPIDTTRTRAHPVPQDRNRLDHEPLARTPHDTGRPLSIQASSLALHRRLLNQPQLPR